MSAFRRSLVVPVYREQDRIAKTIYCLANGPLNAIDTEIIFVDDGSDDHTIEVVRANADASGLRLRLIRLGSNRGKGAAVRTGVLAARGATIVFTDADLSTPVTDVVRCFEMIEANQADVVFGSRSEESSKVDAPPTHRVVAGRTFNRLLQGLGLAETMDTQCGLKGFRRASAQPLFAAVRTNGFAFDVEVLARANRTGLRVEPLAVNWSHVGSSRVRPVRDGARMAVDAARIRASLTLGSQASELTTVAESGAMAQSDVDRMAEIETDHWWFDAKRRLVLEALASIPAGSRLVDVGAGGGALVADLRRRGIVATAIDGSISAADHTRRGTQECVAVVADAGALPIRSASLDALTSLDVIEHLDDDVAAFVGYARCLVPGGLLVVTVPAYNWAWSGHDIRLGHRRRYTASRLAAAIEPSGLVVERVTYFHSWLVPLAAVVRRTPLGRLVDDQEGTGVGGGPSAAVLDRLTRIEQKVLSRRSMPFGLSLLLVARRPVRPLRTQTSQRSQEL